MIEIFNGSVYNFGSASSIWATISYEKKRNGADMQYRFNYKIRLSNRSGGTASSASYQNNVQGKFYLNNVNVYTKSVKSSSTNWSYEYTTEWFDVEDKIDGTVPFKFTIKDTVNSLWCNYSSTTYQLEIDPAGSNFKTVSNFNIGQPFTITTNKYNEDLYDKLVIKLGTTIIKTMNNVGTTIQVDFTSSELNTIYSSTKTVQNADFTFEISSYEDTTMSTQIGITNTKVVKGYIIASNPIISSKSAIDTNDTTIALTGSNTKLIRLYSNVKVSINATGQNQATIKSITVNNQAATNGVITFNKTNTNVFNIVVTDSRGFQTTDSITLEMVNYIELTLSPNVSRNLPTDNKVNISYSGNCFNGSFGAVNNTIKVQYRFKVKGQTFTDTDVWYDMTPTVYDDNTYEENDFIVENVDYQKLYEFQVRVVDELMIKQVIGIIVRKGEPVFNWDDDEFNVKVNATMQKDLEVAGNLKVDNGINSELQATARYENTEINNTLEKGRVKFLYNVNAKANGLFPASNNANSIIQFNKHVGDYDSQLGFSSNGKIYYKSCLKEKLEANGWNELAFMDNAIVESSFETDSSYVKFGNGLMITMQTVTANVAITTSAAGWYGGTFPDITFPAEFIEAPYPSISVVGGTLVSVGRIEEITSTQLVGLRLVRGTSHTANITLKMTAIGRWK